MSGHRKKIKSLVEDEAALEDSIDELAEAIAEETKESYRSKLEPFEIYAERGRMKLHENFNLFRKRFSKGYQVLLEEIKKEHSQQK